MRVGSASRGAVVTHKVTAVDILFASTSYYVVACATTELIILAAAGQRVVTKPTDENISPVTRSRNDIVAFAAIEPIDS